MTTESNYSKKYINLNDESLDIVEPIIEKTYDCICKNPNSIELFKDTHNSLEYFKKLYRMELHRVYGGLCPYMFIAFYDKENPDPRVDEAIGVCLFAVDTPWYNPKLPMLIELCTASFKRGSGLTRRIADFMEAYAKKHGIKLIGTACANSYLSKVVENAYTKKGFKSYKAFYKEIN